MINDYACTDCGGQLLRTKYQGDDIILNIKLKDSNGDYVDLTTYDNIFVYAYTDYENDIVVRGAVDITGHPTYVELNYIDDYTCEFTIDSLYTCQMNPGSLKLEINFEKENLTNNDILDTRHNSIAISGNVLYLAASNIKAESNPGIS